MRCLAWNCRGLRRPAAERAIKRLSQGEGFDVIYLMETKVDEESMYAITTKLGFQEYRDISSMGMAGGFCVAWRKGIKLSIRNKFNSGFECRIEEDHKEPWTLFCIYGTPYGREKGAFWRWLTYIVCNCDTRWMVWGDLNVILNDEEKKGGREFHNREGAHLQNFLLETRGVDLGFSGPKFTWVKSRGSHNSVRKRLDRAVACAHWCLSFPEASVVHHPIMASDHAPWFWILNQ
ncbi:uncharacterized protein LOC133035908 [Cannabis sativa]|uniref:uncharacterized protein LOC133035908 n=1 Tax=Cannabis sativa TaxID=3483 RepID=UPI0029CA004E|nr:uncharacterized protein LOC133035908 [Cannabis sativa]